MIDKTVANVIILAVTLIWVLNFGATLVVDNYKSDPLVHTAFMAIVGGAFALSRKSKDDDSTGKRQGGGES